MRLAPSGTGKVRFLALFSLVLTSSIAQVTDSQFRMITDKASAFNGLREESGQANVRRNQFSMFPFRTSCKRLVRTLPVTPDLNHTGPAGTW